MCARKYTMRTKETLTIRISFVSFDIRCGISIETDKYDVFMGILFPRFLSFSFFCARFVREIMLATEIVKRIFSVQLYAEHRVAKKQYHVYLGDLQKKICCEIVIQ